MSSLNIQHQLDLTPHTTFGFAQRAAHFAEVSSEAQVHEAVLLAQQKNWPILALGGGSNLIVSQDYPGLIIKQTAQEIVYSRAQDPAETWVTASAGVPWHSLVMDTIGRNLTGLENLSLIPGLTGAAPVQNIGAYGVELCDRFVSLRALHLPSGQWQTLNAEQCEFSYRDSHFKRHEGQYIITSVTLKLGDHLGLHTDYATLADYLEQDNPGQKIDAQRVSQAVCAVRSSRLPDPAVLPNAGSFFHNPVISADHFAALKKRFPQIVGHALTDKQYKLAAGWLIDHLGYKGYRHNGVGVHDQQALVLIKYQQTDASELILLADRIREHVRREFDVSLSIEPRIL